MFLDDDIHPLTPPEGAHPRPWELAKPAPNGGWSEVLNSIRTALKRRENAIDHPGNRLFLVRLGKDIAEEGMKLPDFPMAVKQVEHLMKRDIADAFKFSKLLETDPALEHAVWYHANSVQYSRPASSFRGAIARLSQMQMWRLITRVGIESAVWHVPKMDHWVSRQQMHAVITAEVAAHLTQQDYCPEYLCGLLHSIGRLSIYRAAVRHRRSPAPETAFVESIANEFHATIGVLIARCWGLEPVIIGAIAHHNSPKDAPAESKKAAWMVHLASIVAHTAMAEAEGLDSEGREALGELKGVRFNIEDAFDVAHDALSECEAFQAAQQANDEEQRSGS